MQDKMHKLDPTQMDYWLADAAKLKQSADLCWAAKENIQQSAVNAKLFGLEKSLIEAADDAESELNWLYPNLIAFAIQHLAIGILLSHKPLQIIEQGAHFSIINVVESCGVQIKPQLREVISEVENSFKWNEKVPQLSVRLSAEQIQTLKRHKSTISVITPQQKQEFDFLYNQLNDIAIKEKDAVEATAELKKPPKKKSNIDSSTA